MHEPWPLMPPCRLQPSRTWFCEEWRIFILTNSLPIPPSKPLFIMSYGCHVISPSLQWVLHLYGVCDEQKWSNQKLCPPQPSCWFGKFPRLGEQVRERFVQLFADLACDNAYTVYCIICWYVQYFKVCLFAFVGTIWRREHFMALWFKMKRLRFGQPSQMTKFPILCLSLSLQQIFRESRQWEGITNLSPKQVAEQLTRQVKNCLSFVLCMLFWAEVYLHTSCAHSHSHTH